jgi:hypothetical protein
MITANYYTNALADRKLEYVGHYRTRGAIVPIVAALAMVACTTLGYFGGRASVQSANVLLDAGFTITDPQGYDVERFDDGPIALIQSYSTTDEENPFLTEEEKNHEN